MPIVSIYLAKLETLSKRVSQFTKTLIEARKNYQTLHDTFLSYAAFTDRFMKLRKSATMMKTPNGPK